MTIQYLCLLLFLENKKHKREPGDNPNGKGCVISPSRAQRWSVCGAEYNNGLTLADEVLWLGTKVHPRDHPYDVDLACLGQ